MCSKSGAEIGNTTYIIESTDATNDPVRGACHVEVSGEHNFVAMTVRSVVKKTELTVSFSIIDGRPTFQVYSATLTDDLEVIDETMMGRFSLRNGVPQRDSCEWSSDRYVRNYKTEVK